MTSHELVSQSQQINDKQNRPHFIELLQAADVMHAQAQKLEIVRVLVAIGLSAGAVVAAVAPSLTRPLAIAGVAAAFVAIGVARFCASRSTTATLIQEAFDTELFGLDVNAELAAFPSAEEISRLSGRYRGESKKDWYVHVTDLPQPYAILLCQRENLSWDWPLRRTWANIVQLSAVVWVVIGLVISFVASWTTLDFVLRWIAPSLPALTLAVDLVLTNRSIAADKQQMALEVDQRIGILPAVAPGEALDSEIQAELTRESRSYQDRIFRLRDHQERVPQRLYRMRRRSDETAARAAASMLRARLLGYTDDA